MSTSATPQPLPAAAAPEYFCSRHPGRRAQGVCMTCRRVMCSECSTKIDGINHCIGCLESKSVVPSRREHSVAQRALALVLVVVLFVVLAIWLDWLTDWRW